MIRMSEWCDYYDLLGVSPESSAEELTRAYKYKAYIHHPDRLPGAPEYVRLRAEDDLKKINQAYTVLHDPRQRLEYYLEWTGHRSEKTEPAVLKPRPVVDRPYIRFTNTEPGIVNRAAFTIHNKGGTYSKIWIGDPDSWVRIVRRTSLTLINELPLQIEIEAKGRNWGNNYFEYITVKLDEEEVRIRIDLETKTEPALKTGSISKLKTNRTIDISHINAVKPSSHIRFIAKMKNFLISDLVASITKLLLSLLVITGLVVITGTGYVLFSHQIESVSGTIKFLFEALMLIGIIYLIRKPVYSSAKPGFEPVFWSLFMIASVCAFAGIEPLSSVKDIVIGTVGQMWRYISRS